MEAKRIAVPLTGATVPFELVAPRAPFLRSLAKWVRKQPLGAASAALVLTMIVVAMFAPLLSPYDPLEADCSAMMVAPSAEHWLGTDQFGRDILSLIIWGARTALFIGFTSSILGATVGLVLGVMSAYFGGWFGAPPSGGAVRPSTGWGGRPAFRPPESDLRRVPQAGQAPLFC